MFRMGALLSIAISLGATPAWATTNQFRGVNWGDSRDNFQSGVVYVSGLSSSDTYSSALATGTSVMTPVRVEARRERRPNAHQRGNRLRLLEHVHGRDRWRAFPGQRRPLLLGQRQDQQAPGHERFLEHVEDGGRPSTAANENAYFEIFNEPNMYSTNDLIALYTSWLTQFPTVPKSRVILDGTGNAQNVPNIASASALNGCLLAVHDYSFFGSDTWTSESQWVSHFKGEVGNYADRTVCTEWGGPMSPGSKNGTSYGALDYSKSPTNYFEAYIRGMSSQLRAWKMGSFYWAGLKDGDWYSMTTRSGTGSNTVLSVPNPSGLAQLQNAWTGGDTTGGGGTAGGGGTTGHAGAGGTTGAGAGGIGGATLGTGGGGGLAGASSVGHGGSMVSTGGASGGAGASAGIGGTTASAGGSQASFGGTGGLALGSAGTSAGGSGRGGSSSATDADGNASTGCSCTTARGSRNSAGGLTLLMFAAIGVARRRRVGQNRAFKSRQTDYRPSGPSR